MCEHIRHYTVSGRLKARVYQQCFTIDLMPCQIAAGSRRPWAPVPGRLWFVSCSNARTAANRFTFSTLKTAFLQSCPILHHVSETSLSALSDWGAHFNVIFVTIMLPFLDLSAFVNLRIRNISIPPLSTETVRHVWLDLCYLSNTTMEPSNRWHCPQVSLKLLDTEEIVHNSVDCWITNHFQCCVHHTLSPPL